MRAVLSRQMVDDATIFGPNPATDRYDIVLLHFKCHLTIESAVTVGTGVGVVRTSYITLLYPPEVKLPDGYWEVEVAVAAKQRAGANFVIVAPENRYAQRANSATFVRDTRGNICWRSIDLDIIGPVPS